jgi:hypothetical protein
LEGVGMFAGLGWVWAKKYSPSFSLLSCELKLEEKVSIKTLCQIGSEVSRYIARLFSFSLLVFFLASWVQFKSLIYESYIRCETAWFVLHYTRNFFLCTTYLNGIMDRNRSWFQPNSKWRLVLN